MVDLDSQLAEDHRARLVWAFVESLDLSAFYDRIRARDTVARRPATDPPVVLAVWLYATLEGVGSARAIDRLCRHHTAYRWLCGARRSITICWQHFVVRTRASWIGC